MNDFQAMPDAHQKVRALGPNTRQADGLTSGSRNEASPRYRVGKRALYLIAGVPEYMQLGIAKPPT